MKKFEIQDFIVGLAVSSTCKLLPLCFFLVLPVPSPELSWRVLVLSSCFRRQIISTSLESDESGATLCIGSFDFLVAPLKHGNVLQGVFVKWFFLSFPSVVASKVGIFDGFRCFLNTINKLLSVNTYFLEK